MGEKYNSSSRFPWSVPCKQERQENTYKLRQFRISFNYLSSYYILEKKKIFSFFSDFLSGSRFFGIRLDSIDLLLLSQVQWASQCFPIDNAGGQGFTHMIARPSINKDFKNRKTI